jgi:hypothetical protein
MQFEGSKTRWVEDDAFPLLFLYQISVCVYWEVRRTMRAFARATGQLALE